MRKSVWFLGISLVLALLLAVAGATAQEPKVLEDSFLSGDVPSLDPSLATDTSSIQLIIEIFPGLTRLDELTLELGPGVATWEVSEDGLTYTFSIMEGISWVKYNPDSGAVEQVTDENGDVRMLTAHDFVYAVQRTLAPETAGNYAYVLAPWIVGGSEYNGGEGSVDDLAIEALDDYTLQITAPEKAAFVPNIYGMWMATAEPSWVIDEFADSWTEPENIQSYGPFALKEWNHEENISMIKNPFWPGTDNIPQPKLDEVNFTMLDESAQLANYEAGLMHVADPPLADLDRIKADPVLSKELSIGPGTCTYYYGFNVAKEPFTDPRVRLAFSMAVDRQSLIDNVLKGEQLPAGFFSKPELVAAPHQEDYPEFAVLFDPEGAKAELQAYLDEQGITTADLPPITLMHNESEAHARIAQAIQQMWSETLGVEVQIATQEWAVFLTTIDEDAPQMYRLGWCLDYPDTSNFLFDVWHSSMDPRGNWSNAEFDALTEEARVLDDTDARRELYAQAETILVRTDPAMIPIYYYTSLDMTKPEVERTYSLIGNEYYEKWDLSG